MSTIIQTSAYISNIPQIVSSSIQARQAEFYLDQGATFNINFPIYNFDGTAFDLTNCAVLGWMGKSYEDNLNHENHNSSILQLIVSVQGNPKLGMINWKFNELNTLCLEQGRYFFNIDIVQQQNEFRVLKGIINVMPAIYPKYNHSCQTPGIVSPFTQNLGISDTATFYCPVIVGSLGFLDKITLASNGMCVWIIYAGTTIIGYEVTNGSSTDYNPPANFIETTTQDESFSVVAQNLDTQTIDIFATFFCKAAGITVCQNEIIGNISPNFQEIGSNDSVTFSSPVVSGNFGCLKKLSLASSGFCNWIIYAGTTIIGYEVTNGTSKDYDLPRNGNFSQIQRGEVYSAMATNLSVGDIDVFATFFWVQY